MLEYLADHGYDADLAAELYQILFTGWTETEAMFLWVFIILVTAPIMQRLS